MGFHREHHRKRPNPGPMTRLELDRLMQYCFRNAIERRCGTAASEKNTDDAGYIAGRAPYGQVVTESLSLTGFIPRLQRILERWGSGS